LAGLGADQIRAFVVSVVSRIQVHTDRIEIVLDSAQVLRWPAATSGNHQTMPDVPTKGDGCVMTLTVPARLRRAGKEMRIMVDSDVDARVADPSLMRVLVRGHAIRAGLFADGSLTLDEIARSEGVTPSYATRLFRLTLLAPDILSAILGGQQPPELTARKLMDDTRLPLDWNEQRRYLGFA
jgi:site-specific DNA recombinase